MTTYRIMRVAYDSDQFYLIEIDRPVQKFAMRFIVRHYINNRHKVLLEISILPKRFFVNMHYTISILHD